LKTNIDIDNYRIDLEKLSPEVIDLLSEAEKQVEMAYAPYSNFKVGAAILSSEKKIYGGSNQENASYPLCMCAERVAAYHAISVNPYESFIAIGITAKNANNDLIKPVTPCGACRQVLMEYQNRFKHPIELYILGPKKEVYCFKSINEFLPFSFDQSFL
jgi:cytidine deaminase